ncbi:RnfH family protein [Pseudomonas sp. 21LCFQ010]|uniref:RnfH family protein n=1 Tax=Pseudomonas sp. 21LCFQ010 TaxID=2957506 RepID=UPI0020979A38|nr:RnfH family protein [Pseudomonas sp. 21LCFQ010]MCO8164153.1 RnfH family protein [Pseudomonas sp. 21LCFQ010]
MSETPIEIEVVHASLERQVMLRVKVAAGTTVRQALQSSGIGAIFPELELESCAVGVFGKLISDPDCRVMESGERIEIYRPLLADPKEVRRLRAAKAEKARPKKGRA